MKKYFKYILLCCCVLFLYCYSKKDTAIIWRYDTDPIVKRIPVLTKCTDMTWHAEDICNNSFSMVPGKSCYRIFCIIPNSSQYITELKENQNQKELLPSNHYIEFYDEETNLLKSQYNLDVNADVYTTNLPIIYDSLDYHRMFQRRILYFYEKDILIITFYLE